MADSELNLGEGVTQPLVVTTHPSHILRHSISDEELDMLGGVKPNRAGDISLVCLGGSISSAPPAIDYIINYFSEKELPVIGFLTVVVFFMCLASCLVTFFVSRGELAEAKGLKERIRSRKYPEG